MGIKLKLINGGLIMNFTKKTVLAVVVLFSSCTTYAMENPGLLTTFYQSLSGKLPTLTNHMCNFGERLCYIRNHPTAGIIQNAINDLGSKITSLTKQISDLSQPGWFTQPDWKEIKKLEKILTYIKTEKLSLEMYQNQLESLKSFLGHHKETLETILKKDYKTLEDQNLINKFLELIKSAGSNSETIQNLEESYPGISQNVTLIEEIKNGFRVPLKNSFELKAERIYNALAQMGNYGLAQYSAAGTRLSDLANWCSLHPWLTAGYVAGGTIGTALTLCALYKIYRKIRPIQPPQPQPQPQEDPHAKFLQLIINFRDGNNVSENDINELSAILQTKQPHQKRSLTKYLGWSTLAGLAYWLYQV